jgi:hypothetical protein
MEEKSGIRSQMQIPKSLVDYINLMVEEVLLRGDSFEKNRKWLKKNCELARINYEELEKALDEFFDVLKDYDSTRSETFKRVVAEKAARCHISEELLLTLTSQKIAAPTWVDEEQVRVTHTMPEPKNPDPPFVSADPAVSLRPNALEKKLTPSLVFSILATIIGNVIFGILAIIESVKAKQRFLKADYAGCEKSLKYAYVYRWISIAVGIVFLMIVLL